MFYLLVEDGLDYKMGLYYVRKENWEVDGIIRFIVFGVVYDLIFVVCWKYIDILSVDLYFEV